MINMTQFFKGACVLKWMLLWPPCSVGFAATSTSSSERLSQLHFSSWCTRTSSTSGLCHGSPTSLMKSHILYGHLTVGHTLLKQETSCRNLKGRCFIHFVVNIDYFKSEILKADSSPAAPAVLTLNHRLQHLGPKYTLWPPTSAADHFLHWHLE